MKYTRRELLETGLAGSIAMGVGGLVKISVPQSLVVESTFAAEKPEESALLQKIMDEIIPAVDGMPAASEVGGVHYLDRLMSGSQEIAGKLRSALASVEKTSQARFTSPFLSISGAQRLEVLTAFESEDRRSFDSMRDYIYEAYYTNERVWSLIGYRNFPTNDGGPHMAAFDEEMLAEVRKRPKLYREI